MLSLLIHLPKCFTFEDIVCIIWNFLDGTNWTKIIKPYGRVLRLQDAISFIENPSGTAENTNRCQMGLSTDMSHPSSSQQPFPHTHPPPFLTPQLLPVFRLIFREVSCVVPPPPQPNPRLQSECWAHGEHVIAELSGFSCGFEERQQKRPLRLKSWRKRDKRSKIFSNTFVHIWTSIKCCVDLRQPQWTNATDCWSLRLCLSADWHLWISDGMQKDYLPPQTFKWCLYL